MIILDFNVDDVDGLIEVPSTTEEIFG